MSPLSAIHMCLKLCLCCIDVSQPDYQFLGVVGLSWLSNQSQTPLSHCSVECCLGSPHQWGTVPPWNKPASRTGRTCNNGTVEPGLQCYCMAIWCMQAEHTGYTTVGQAPHTSDTCMPWSCMWIDNPAAVQHLHYFRQCEYSATTWTDGLRVMCAWGW